MIDETFHATLFHAPALPLHLCGGRQETHGRRGKPQRRRRVPSAAKAGDATGTDDKRYELRLYVSPNSISCVRARMALERVLERFDHRAYTLAVVDVREDVEAASRAQILFTPTLILHDGSAPPTRVLGDLSNERILLDLLLPGDLERS